MCVFFFNCSNDGFEKPKPSDIASWAGLEAIDDTPVKCFVGESCYEISRSACDIIGGEEKPDKNCISFACEWNSNSVEYGQESTLSFKWGNVAQEGCSVKISPLDTGKHLISASTIAGLSYSNDTTIVAEATVTCETAAAPIVQNCKPLIVKSVPGPEKKGELSFDKSKVNYTSNDSNYFFIGTKIDSTYIKNTIEITNKELYGCGDIKVKIEGTPAKLGTQVRATAVVTCSLIGELELDGISAEVLPDYKIGKCELAGNSKTTMLSKDTLTVAIDTSDIYKRCNKIEYTFNGTTYSSSNSFALTNSGNTDLKNIKAKVTCNGKDTIVACPAVTVASYIYSTTCKDGTYDIDIPKGTTIIGLACSTSKNGKGDDGADNNWNAYYINCQNKDYNLSVSGGRIKEAPGNGLSYNFFPDTEPIKEGNLYRYPYDIIIKADEVLKCGIW